MLASQLEGDYIHFPPDEESPVTRTITFSNVADSSSVTVTDPARRILIVDDDDEDSLPHEHFWWEITGVTGHAVLADGDGVWGKTIIADDDIPPPVPDPQADLPWGAEGNIQLSRPADSIITGVPIFFYLQNIEEWCKPEGVPKAHKDHCGTDFWPTNHLSPRQWKKTGVVWQAAAGYDGMLEANVFEADRVVLDLRDEWGQITECVNNPPAGEAGYGLQAPGRRYLWDRVAPAPDEPGAGECTGMYYKRGYYVLHVSVGWKQWACRGPDADADGVPEVATVVCGGPIDRVDLVKIPVTVVNVFQRSWATVRSSCVGCRILDW